MALAGGGAVATENGDTNGDGARDITDAVYLLSWLFTGGAEPVALAQQGGNDEAIEELRAQIAELQSSSRLANTAIVSNMDAIAGLREDLHPVAFSGNFEELENVPVAQGGDCCEQEASWLTSILRITSGARFRGFNDMELHHHNFNGADLRGVNLDRDMEFFSCTFRDADLREAVLGGRMLGVDFRGANLADAQLGTATKGKRMTGVNFEGANLQGAVFLTSEYSFSNFRSVDLSGQMLRRKNFESSNMSNADLMDADLRDAKMFGVDFTGADLTGANVDGADMRRTIGLNLEGTIGTPILE